MKQFLTATIITLSVATSALAGGTGKIEDIKKAEKVEAPATPKAMPKVDKPKTRKEKLADCLEEKKLDAAKCEKKYGEKNKK